MSISGEIVRHPKRAHDDVAVFDRRYRVQPRMVKGGGHYEIAMPRTSRDRVPARSNVTAQLLGDPRPGRSAQDKLDQLRR